MTTLSYLVEAVRGEAALPEDSGLRMELLSLEMSRMLDIIDREMPSTREPDAVVPVGLRALAGQVTQLANVAHERTEVSLLPGGEVTVEASPALLWRVLTNVVDNAARAAGPGGIVEISVDLDREAAIEVTDDGPGFSQGPPGTASLGLPVVKSLLESCDGRLEVHSPEAGGTTVRIVLPAPRGAAGSGRDRARAGGSGQ